MSKKHKIVFYHKHGISQSKISNVLNVSGCIVWEVIKKKELGISKTERKVEGQRN